VANNDSDYLDEPDDVEDSELDIQPDDRIHASPIKISGFKPTAQYSQPLSKPNGLWYALGSGWIDIVSSGYHSRLNAPNFIYSIDVNYAPDGIDIIDAASKGKRIGGVFRIDGHSDAVAFGDLFGDKVEEEVLQYDGSFRYITTIRDIRWNDVSRIFDGVEVVLSQDAVHKRETYWLYGWDVHGGCIWGSGGIRDMRLISAKGGNDMPVKNVPDNIKSGGILSRLRSLIREVVVSLDEASATPSSLPPGFRVDVETGMSSPPASRRMRASYVPSILGWYVRILDEDGNMVGSIRVEKRGSNQVGSLNKDNCLDAYEVTQVATKIKGLGPLMYDIAAELAGEKGIMSDRFSVSPSARRIWDFYITQRTDVEIKQLPDDCNMTAASEEGDWESSPLSKVVVKRNRSVIDELESLGIIDFVDA